MVRGGGSVTIFIVSQPDYDGENIDSVWDSEDQAFARAAELSGVWIVEYELGAPDGWIRGGWYEKSSASCEWTVRA